VPFDRACYFTGALLWISPWCGGADCLLVEGQLGCHSSQRLSWLAHILGPTGRLPRLSFPSCGFHHGRSCRAGLGQAFHHGRCGNVCRIDSHHSVGASWFSGCTHTSPLLALRVCVSFHRRRIIKMFSSSFLPSGWALLKRQAHKRFNAALVLTRPREVKICAIAERSKSLRSQSLGKRASSAHLLIMPTSTVPFTKSALQSPT